MSCAGSGSVRLVNLQLVSLSRFIEQHVLHRRDSQCCLAPIVLLSRDSLGCPFFHPYEAFAV